MANDMSRLEVALLSSFSVIESSRPGTSGLDYWPDGISSVEVYAFMQNDCMMLAELMGIEDASPLNLMATAAREHENVEIVSSFLDRKYRRHAIDIAAIHTYLPEIVASDSLTAESAQCALLFLIQVCRSLRNKAHSLKTVVVTAGSTIDQVLWHPGEEHKPQFILRNRSRREMLQLFIDRITPVAEECYADRDFITLAVELDPGPLFSIGGWDSLSDFCHDLDTSTSSSIRRCVGVNLDIAHWGFLGGIDPDRVLSSPHVLNRICHGHISDHSVGHISDLVPGTFHEVDEFRKWLNVLKKRTDGGGVPYSNYVGLELECIQDEKLLGQAASVLLDLTK